MAASGFSTERHKRVLVVLFVPSADRDGKAVAHQAAWLEEALACLGELYGGATAYPRALGVWRDDERGGVLIKDEPYVLHCYTTPEDIEDERKLKALGAFCRRMGRETNQGEVGLVIGDEYIGIRDFTEE